MNARKCQWCNTHPCPYPSDDDFRRQWEHGGREWLETMPCWTPFPENIGTLHDENGQLIQEQGEGV